MPGQSHCDVNTFPTDDVITQEGMLFSDVFHAQSRNKCCHENDTKVLPPNSRSSTEAELPVQIIPKNSTKQRGLYYNVSEHEQEYNGTNAERCPQNVCNDDITPVRNAFVEKPLNSTATEVRNSVSRTPLSRQNDELHASLSHKNDVENGDESNTSQRKNAALEKQHVHDVYDKTARHFGNARHKAWPSVKRFLQGLHPGALVADVGCGHGKYLHINKNVYKLGSDHSAPLVDIAATKGQHNVMVCDNLALPYRSDCFDAVISVGVIHHFSTVERRIQALNEIGRVLRPGGRVMIYVWAMEQEKRKFRSQDVLVPWHLRQKTPVTKRVHKERCYSNSSLSDNDDTFQNSNLSNEDSHAYNKPYKFSEKKSKFKEMDTKKFAITRNHSAPLLTTHSCPFVDSGDRHLSITAKELFQIEHSHGGFKPDTPGSRNNSKSSHVMSSQDNHTCSGISHVNSDFIVIEAASDTKCSNNSSLTSQHADLTVVHHCQHTCSQRTCGMTENCKVSVGLEQIQHNYLKSELRSQNEVNSHSRIESSKPGFGFESTGTKQSQTSLSLESTGTKQSQTSLSLESTGTKQSQTSISIESTATKQSQTSISLESTGTKQSQTSISLESTGTKQSQTSLASRIKRKLANLFSSNEKTKQLDNSRGDSSELSTVVAAKHAMVLRACARSQEHSLAFVEGFAVREFPQSSQPIAVETEPRDKMGAKLKCDSEADWLRSKVCNQSDVINTNSGNTPGYEENKDVFRQQSSRVCSNKAMGISNINTFQERGYLENESSSNQNIGNTSRKSSADKSGSDIENWETTTTKVIRRMESQVSLKFKMAAMDSDNTVTSEKQNGSHTRRNEEKSISKSQNVKGFARQLNGTASINGTHAGPVLHSGTVRVTPKPQRRYLSYSSSVSSFSSDANSETLSDIENEETCPVFEKSTLNQTLVVPQCSNSPVCNAPDPTQHGPESTTWQVGDNSSEILSDNDENRETLKRYYHVFKQNELDDLIENQVNCLNVVESFYDHANWCVIAEKVQIWKI